jgi:hypothetical protein
MVFGRESRVRLSSHRGGGTIRVVVGNHFTACSANAAFVIANEVRHPAK